MQTALATTFMEHGREVFHGLSKGDVRYDPATVDAMFDRKLAEREEKDFGWPSCQKFEEYGSTQCATCPLKGTIRSPLNLPLPTADAQEQAPTSTTETATTTAETSQILQAAVPFKISCGPYVVLDEQTLPMWDFIYGRHLLRGTVSGSAAAGGIGKTTLSISEALAIASGKMLLGIPVSRPMRMLIINLEDDRGSMDKRVTAAMKHHRLTQADIGDRLFLIARGELEFQLGPKAGAVNTKKFSDALIDFIKENQIDVVSVDPLIRVHREDESDPVAMKAVVEVFEKIALQCNCAVSLWNHTRKGDVGEVTADSSRGTGAYADALRSLRMFDIMTAQEARNMNVEKRFAYFKSFDGKLNYAPKAENCDWYRLENVPLLNGGSGRIGDCVGAATAWTIPTTATLTPDQVSKICSALANGLGRDRQIHCSNPRPRSKGTQDATPTNTRHSHQRWDAQAGEPAQQKVGNQNVRCAV